MATYALEQGGVAHQIWRNITDPDVDIPPIHEDLRARIHLAPDAVEEGWLWNESKFVAPTRPPPPTDEDVRQTNIDDYIVRRWSLGQLAQAVADNNNGNAAAMTRLKADIAAARAANP